MNRAKQDCYKARWFFSAHGEKEPTMNGLPILNYDGSIFPVLLIFSLK
ncbi:MAG: hypothetical protein KKE10_08765 [Proteobacteria bacterium]|jgi:hypothetical protein|nr:hypothetical protein [Pseudomonadota bacterium]